LHPSSDPRETLPLPEGIVLAQPHAEPMRFGAIVNMTSDPYRSGVETSLAIDPTNEDHLFACSPPGLGGAETRTPVFQSYYYESKDGGETWHDLDVVVQATDMRQYVPTGGDCDVAFDDAGTMYAADNWAGSIAVGASRDDGATWTGTPLAGAIPVGDRPWLVGGPAGTVYLTYHDLQVAMPPATWFTVSKDYGQTFSVPTPMELPTEGLRAWEGNFVVHPNGQDLYSTYIPNSYQDPTFQVRVAISHDGGKTWASRLVSQRSHFASILYSSIAMDEAGFLHVAWTEEDGSVYPAYYSTSHDQGQTWSEPVQLVNEGTATASWVAAGKPGSAVVVWYGTPSQPSATAGNWSLYYAQLRNGTVMTRGPTTPEPLYSGPTSTYPEFEQVRLDSHGRAFMAAAKWMPNPSQAAGATPIVWRSVFQRQTAGPPI
jgi:hypothetical protein